MSEHKPRPQLAEPMGGLDAEHMGDMYSFAQAAGGQMVTAGAGQLAVNTFGSVITAQRVAVPRNLNQVLQNLKTLCAMNGTRYVYSWEVNDRKNNRKQTIEGPTVKLANDLARTYGNCVVDVRAVDEGEHILFYARFTDLETGFSYTRPFQQRKRQDLGMRGDAERQADIVFQIGASKAIRNCVVNALDSFVAFMIEESAKNVIEWVTNNRERADKFIDGVMDKFSIALKRVEAVVGRRRKEWTARDIARVFTEMRGIVDGMTVADEVYPSEADAERIEQDKAAKDAKGRKREAAADGGGSTDPSPPQGEGGEGGASDAERAAAERQKPTAAKPSGEPSENDNLFGE